MDEFTEVTNESWFGRIGSAFKGIILGIVLFVVAFPILFWNEGRAVKTYKALKEGEGAVISITAESVDAVNDKKLVHLTAEATTKDILEDSEFAVSANALKLIRDVETYQWKENKETKSKKKLGGGKRKTTTYTYKKLWSAKKIDSDEFKKPEGHTNPKSGKFSSDEFLAKDVKLGAFKLSETLLSKINKAEKFNVDPETLPALLKDMVKSDRGGYFYGKNSSTPQIGDQRITFKIVKPMVVSVISQQVGDTFEPYVTKVGESLELLETGTKTSKAMFQTAISKNATLTWILRLVGFILMVIGIALILKPLSVLADVVPFIGSIIEMGAVVIALLVAAFFSIITIAVAWIFYRPLLGIGLIVVAVACLAVVFALKKKKGE